VWWCLPCRGALRLSPEEAPLDVGEIVQVRECQARLRLLRHCLEEVSLDVGEIAQVRECQARLGLLRYGLRRLVVRLVAGRGGCALACGQREGGGREPGQRLSRSCGMGPAGDSQVAWPAVTQGRGRITPSGQRQPPG
jgi:hypothetical protein